MKPYLKVSWCISKVDSAFLAKMEAVLAVYATPYDAAYPVVCFDERPCFLIADTIAPIPHLSSFYEHLPADEAKRLADRFEFHYTPKSASLLNMIEIEFSALSKQCLHRRIGTKEMLAEQIAYIIKERNEKNIIINWQFSIQKARTNLNKSYTDVNPNNIKFKQT